MLKGICIFGIVFSGVICIISSIVLDFKGNNAAGIPSGTVVVEHEGNYYWRIKGESPTINTDSERRMEIEQYDVYRSYQIKGQFLFVFGFILISPCMLYSIFSGLKKKSFKL